MPLDRTLALGTHLLVELYECDAAALDDVAGIELAMVEAALAGGATIIDRRFHRFAPHGVSGVVIIAESHLTIHTWPEHAYAAIDVFTCGSSVDTEACAASLRERLQSKRHTTVSLDRGPLAHLRGS
ncbi:MAG: adenosylmethionine decarboxylase [Pseudomonadota bacterium]|nr:adenosylmethionine decarboxylase [Pseudomonadota bacterium]